MARSISVHPVFHSSIKSSLKLMCALAGLALANSCLAGADDLTSQYQWKPVRIGVGGWVVGMVLHPLDATVRYARTDVGNGYRWDEATQEWYPMRVKNSDGSGVQSASETGAPSGYGVESIAVDPANKSVVYMVFPTVHSCDVQCPTGLIEIYKSVDGGHNFSPGNMKAAAIKGDPNGAHRWAGERLNIDPANTSIMYYASDSQGLFRSLDGGITWNQLSGASAPPTNIEFINIQFARAPGIVTVGGASVSKTIYAVSVSNSGDAGGDVYQSSDGGQTWTDISTGVTDAASGQNLSHQALASSIDGADALYVAENNVTNGWRRAYWRFASGKWTRFSLEGSINQAVVSVAADPTNPQRIYALGADTSLSRSDDGGTTWINLGGALYSNTLAWLPQTVGMNGGNWHSNGGIKLDAQGNLWTPTGQEGPMTIAASAASSATAANPPKWTILSKGIEELVTQDIVVPPGNNDTIIAAAMDTTGFVIPNPDNFGAVQIPLQQEGISQGTSVEYSPDAPSYIAITSSNVYTNGPSYSGYSPDGGKTWHRFGPALQYTCGSSRCEVPAGMIAVSVRGTRTLGSDHIALYPPGGLLPEYSLDGGATWHATTSFPSADGMTISSADYNSFLYPQLNQHLLRADPFTADKFYLKFTHAPNMLYISIDGGKTWTGQPGANLPDNAWQGQLTVNGFVKDDLWYADGWEGSTLHGVFHSTDGGQTFQKLSGITHAITVAIGAPSGQSGDANYSIYLYGLLASDPQWGIFRSTNGGATWDRISFYPTGIYDIPRTMTASQDTFGKVYVGLSGNSFVYGQIASNTPPPVPAAPTALSAIAASDTEIDLSWVAPSGTVDSYNVYRGITSQGESLTPIKTGLTASSYPDTSLTKGTVYYYKVTAANIAGEGPASGEGSAKSLQPTVSLAAASGGSTSQTVAQGQSATFQLVLNSTNYSGAITFSCTGAPAGYTCVAPTPTSITPATTTTAVNIKVQAGGSAASHPLDRGLLAAAAGLFFLPVCFLRNRKRLVVIMLLAVALMMAANGCGSGSGGGGGGSTGPSPVTSTLTVTAQGPGVTTVTQLLTLTVQ